MSHPSRLVLFGLVSSRRLAPVPSSVQHLVSFRLAPSCLVWSRLAPSRLVSFLSPPCLTSVRFSSYRVFRLDCNRFVWAQFVQSRHMSSYPCASPTICCIGKNHFLPFDLLNSICLVWFRRVSPRLVSPDVPPWYQSDSTPAVRFAWAGFVEFGLGSCSLAKCRRRPVPRPPKLRIDTTHLLPLRSCLFSSRLARSGLARSGLTRIRIDRIQLLPMVVLGLDSSRLGFGWCGIAICRRTTFPEPAMFGIGPTHILLFVSPRQPPEHNLPCANTAATAH